MTTMVISTRIPNTEFNQAQWDALVAQLDTRERALASKIWDTVLELYDIDDSVEAVVAAINALRIQLA